MQKYEENLLSFLQFNTKVFNISYINDIELELPNKTLYRFIKQEGYYKNLGKNLDKVLNYFERFGFDKNQNYSQIL